MNLGIIYENNKMINHRSFIKVIFNPILRYFGYCIGTKLDEKTQTLKGIILFKQEKSKKIKWERYDMTGKTIVKKRLII